VNRVRSGIQIDAPLCDTDLNSCGLCSSIGKNLLKPRLRIILAGATGDTAPIMSVSQFAMDA
jgi:hypothetical protein